MISYQDQDPAALSGPDLARWIIWDACQRSGLSRREISLRAGINESGLSQILSRTQFIPQPGTLRALCDVHETGLSYMYLMTLFGHIDPPSAPDAVDHMLAPVKAEILRLPEEQRHRATQQLLAIARTLAP